MVEYSIGSSTGSSEVSDSSVALYYASWDVMCG
jgi:hypothetical protein